MTAEKFLTLSRDGQRLTLVLPDQLPLRAAARAIPGCRFEGVNDRLAVFSFPAVVDCCSLILETFSPSVAQAAVQTVTALQDQAQALDQAVALKGQTAQLQLDPHLQTEPMAHQVQAMNFCAARFDAGMSGSALLMEQGTGKSLVAIGLANHLHATGRIDWVLVICPNSLKGTWGAEDGEVLLHSAPGQVRPHILRGSRDKRQEYLRRRLASDPAGLLWVVTNYDEFAVNIRKRGRDAERFQGTLDIIKAAGPGLLVADESTQCKSDVSLRSRAVRALADLFPYRLILTGTPVECSPLDVWAQYEILGRGTLGFNTFLGFEKTYATYQKMRVRGRAFVQVAGYQNLEDLQQRLGRISYRVRAEDCLDLPPVRGRTVPVELSSEQGRLIRELKSDMMAELGDGLIDGRNILARYQKVAQIIGGWVRVLGPDGISRWCALTPNPKLVALDECLQLALEDPERKVVVFAEHPDTEIAAIQALGQARGWDPVAFYGDVTEAQRDQNRQKFNQDPGCRVFIAQYQCGALGLNLTAADTIAFYSLTWRYGVWAQARKRVHRKGQERPVTELYLLGQMPPVRGRQPRRTLDHLQLEALRSKRDLADLVTGDQAQRILEDL